jgi:hypothetical protein
MIGRRGAKGKDVLVDPNDTNKKLCLSTELNPK